MIQTFEENLISQKDSDNNLRTVGNVFSISSATPFLDVLVDTIMNGKLINGFQPVDDPLSLSQATIFVPSRRAARALSSAFVERFDQLGAVLLPQIRTLGDVSDEEFGLSLEAIDFTVLPEAIKPLPRKLELANLVLKWVETLEGNTRHLYGDEDIVIPSSRSDALLLAEDLCSLLSQVFQEEVSWEQVMEIGQDTNAQWWEITATFLKIIASNWPKYLKLLNLIDPAERSAKLLDLRAERLMQNGSKGPVIVAGSTGSVPSTQRLLKAVSGLSNGAVVLPGLDFNIPKLEWENLSSVSPSNNPAIETHPQFGLARLLKGLKIDRENVEEFGDNHNKPYQALISTALASSEFTSDWVVSSQPPNITETLSHISIIDAGNERSEALAIAIAMRETLETPDKTTALVTPDRNLGQRVSNELKRFGIEVDDTGGTPLANSRPAVFLRLLTQSIFGDGGNPIMTSVLKHPLFLSGVSQEQAQIFGQQIELIGLRGAINPVRFGTLEKGLMRRQQEWGDEKYKPDYIKRLSDKDWASLLDHCTKLDLFFSPLLEFKARDQAFSFADVAQEFLLFMEQVCVDDQGIAEWIEDEGGPEVSRLLMDLIETQTCSFKIDWYDIPGILDALLAGSNTRPRRNSHPRLHIYGPLEMRLLDYDRVILGSLNEGTWPQAVRSDAFINRSMRHELGMASPERRTGLSAHDFQQLMGKREIILTRASRVDKSPTVLSRWLQRLGALIGDEQQQSLIARGNKYLEFAEALDTTEQQAERITAPYPTPPVSARPISLSVTDIENWIRDPYSIYAKYILKLSPVAPLEREPDPMLKGTLYHKIMENYVLCEPLEKPHGERLGLLNALAVEEIDDQNLPKDISRNWILRWQEIAEKYVDWEEEYHQRNLVENTNTELSGRLSLLNETFQLRGRADRIDELADGTLSLIDYKTGTKPSRQQAQTLSPQLALEGLIAKKGGFETLTQTHVADLIYMRLRRGSQFKADSISDNKNSVDAIIERAEEQLLRLITAFQNEEQGYQSRRTPFKESEITGDYDHLARTREWSFAGDGDGDE